jgi:hypothetical protein
MLQESSILVQIVPLLLFLLFYQPLYEHLGLVRRLEILFYNWQLTICL